MTTRITFWKKADGRYLGYLNDYPGHWTQGDALSDLKEQLRDLCQTFSAEEIPGIRKEEKLEVASSAGISSRRLSKLDAGFFVTAVGTIFVTIRAPADRNPCPGTGWSTRSWLAKSSRICVGAMNQHKHA